MFKRRACTHTHTHTHSCISIKLSLLCILFPFFPLSLGRFFRVGVHVHLCALSTACVLNYVRCVAAFAFCLCAIV